VFRGQVDPDHQIHDYNPGISETPGGLFWTIPIDPDRVEWDDKARHARWKEEDLAIPDFHDLFNALQDGPHQRGVVTFDMHWQDGGAERHTRNEDERFDVRWRATTTRIEWHGRSADGTGFESEDKNETETHFALLGNERNGVFFD